MERIVGPYDEAGKHRIALVDWIRWKAKGDLSLWHRARARIGSAPDGTRRRGRILVQWTRGHAIRLDLPDTREIEESVEIDLGDSASVGPRAWRARIYEQTVCGFTVPPFKSVVHWAGDGLPPGPRCIWCVHGWAVDMSSPGGPPPGGSADPRSGPLPPPKKKPPTLHA